MTGRHISMMQHLVLVAGMALLASATGGATGQEGAQCGSLTCLPGYTCQTSTVNTTGRLYTSSRCVYSYSRSEVTNVETRGGQHSSRSCSSSTTIINGVRTSVRTCTDGNGNPIPDEGDTSRRVPHDVNVENIGGGFGKPEENSRERFTSAGVSVCKTRITTAGFLLTPLLVAILELHNAL